MWAWIEHGLALVGAIALAALAVAVVIDRFAKQLYAERE
jgi:hypothetical protein